MLVIRRQGLVRFNLPSSISKHLSLHLGLWRVNITGAVAFPPRHLSPPPPVPSPLRCWAPSPSLPCLSERLGARKARPALHLLRVGSRYH